MMDNILSSIKELLQNQATPYHVEIAVQIRNYNADVEDCLFKNYEWDFGIEESLDHFCHLDSKQKEQTDSKSENCESGSVDDREMSEVSDTLMDKTLEKFWKLQSTTTREENIPKTIPKIVMSSPESHLEVDDAVSNNSRTEEQFRSIQSTLVELCNGIKKIEDSRSSIKTDKERKRIPSDIRKVANKYQHAFAYAFIRQFGRLLQLDERHLDEVEQYSGYGTKEVFWQTIRMWMENSESQDMTVSNLLTALSECGVDLKGKQMSRKDRTILRSKMAKLLESLNPVEALTPYLCSRHLLCEVTKAYVTAPKTSDLKINRLVDILMTKENGLTDFCSVLRDGGYDYIAQEIETERSAASPESSSRLSSLSISMSNSIPSLRESISDPHLRRIAEDYKQKHSSLTSVFRKGSDTSLSTTTKVAAVSPSIQRKMTPQSNDIKIKPDCVQEKTQDSDETVDNETISLVSKENQKKCSCSFSQKEASQSKQRIQGCCVLM